MYVFVAIGRARKKKSKVAPRPAFVRLLREAQGPSCVFFCVVHCICVGDGQRHRSCWWWCWWWWRTEAVLLLLPLLPVGEEDGSANLLNAPQRQQWERRRGRVCGSQRGRNQARGTSGRARAISISESVAGAGRTLPRQIHMYPPNNAPSQQRTHSWMRVHA